MTARKSSRARRGSGRLALSTGLLLVVVVLAVVFRQPPTPVSTASAPASGPAASRPRSIAGTLTPAMRQAASRPTRVPTGLFLDRPAAADFRVMSYNVGWDSIFPSTDARRAEKFQRIVRAVAPDILALQEIRNYSASDVAELLDAIAPLPDGASWHAFKGQAGVIASRYRLTQLSDRLRPSSYRDPAAALVDLPDDRFDVDVYVLNNHFKCCEGEKNDPVRQQQADAVISRIRDARTPGGEVDLAPGTPILIVGDLNLVGGFGPLNTLLTGDVADEQRYGSDLAPDWDGTWLCDVHPLHNAVGPADYTWRDDNSEFAPGRLDFVIYTDSVLEVVNAFVLDTTVLSEEQLSRSGLGRYDVSQDDTGHRFDHLPVVVDFRVVR